MSRTCLGMVVGCAAAVCGPWILAHDGGGPGTGPGGGHRDGRGPSHHDGERALPCYLASFDADGDGVLNEEERVAAQAKIDEVKAKYDADADGRLSCEERQAAVAELCPNVEAPACETRPPHALPCYLASFDADGDGMLNEEERAAAQAKIDEVKAKYDADADGRLSCEERQGAIAELCPDVEAPACTAGRPHDRPLPCFLEAFDADGDGTLNEEERAAAKTKLEEVRAAADTDGDGSVTCAEMRAALEALCADDDAGEAVPAALAALGAGVESVFVRGDADLSGAVELTDAVGVLRFLFQGEATPACQDAADANDDASVDISDASAILSFLFLGTMTLPAPYPEADYDPSEDAMTCFSSSDN